jgi:hypothetical protein
MPDAKPKFTPTQATILAYAALPPRPPIREGDEPREGARCSGPGETTAGYNLGKAGYGEFVSCPGASKFYINDAGRVALQEAIVQASAEAARSLADAVKARGGGNATKATRLEAKAKKWLDMEKILRRDQGAKRT